MSQQINGVVFRFRAQRQQITNTPLPISLPMHIQESGQLKEMPLWHAELRQMELSQTTSAINENMSNDIPGHENTGAILKHSCAYLVQHNPTEN